MKKPEKKEIPSLLEMFPKVKDCKSAIEIVMFENEYLRTVKPLKVYNQACDDWEKWIIQESDDAHQATGGGIKEVALVFYKAIHKRIRG